MSFVRDLSFGEKGEEWLRTWLLGKGVECQEKDENKKGYDLLLTSGTRVEVKSDRYALTTNNILFEIWSHSEIGSPGWLQYSNSEVLCYLLYNDNNEIADVIFYDFLSLKAFLFWVVLKGSWFSQPILGVIKSARRAGSPKARNLLIPRDALEIFEISVDTFALRKDDCSGN